VNKSIQLIEISFTFTKSSVWDNWKSLKKMYKISLGGRVIVHVQ